jgi:predicted nucleic-acid-binding protein
MGVPVLKKLKKSSLEKIVEWIETDARVTVEYKDITADAVELAVRKGREL